MKHNLRILIMVVVFTVVGSSVIAAEVAEVKVYRAEVMPFCGTVDGKHVGITVDILHEVTKHGGPKFTFSELPWARAQTYVKEQTGTAIIPLTRTPSRENQYTWIIQLVSHQVRLTLDRNSVKRKFSLPDPVTLESLKPLPIGIRRGHSHIPLMKKMGFTNLEQVNELEQNARKLAAGRIAAMVMSSWVDNYWWHKIGEKAEDLIIGPSLGDAEHMYLSAGLDFPPELTQQIRDAMKKVEESGDIKMILKKWSSSF